MFGIKMLYPLKESSTHQGNLPSKHKNASQRGEIHGRKLLSKAWVYIPKHKKTAPEIGLFCACILAICKDALPVRCMQIQLGQLPFLPLR